jgi:O-antigen/teichoic acid export membrane protein
MDRVESSSWGSRLARGVFWSGVGAVVSRLFALGAAIVAARVLGKVAFGELGMIQSTVQLFGTFATFGVGLAATRYVAEFRKTDPERAGHVIALSYQLALSSGCAVGLLMVVGATLVADQFLAAPHLAKLVALSALVLIFQVLDQAQIGALSGLEAFRRRSTLQAYGSVVAFPVSLIGVYFFGLTGAVVALAVAGGVLVALNAWGIRKEAALAGIPILWRGTGREVRSILRFNVLAVLSGVVFAPPMWLANVMVANGPDGYAQIGLFSAADRWRTAIVFLPALLGGVALPMLSSLSDASDSSVFKRVLRANVVICSVTSLAVAAPIAVMAPWIMRSYGSDFAEGTWVLVTLCGAAVMHAAYSVIGQSLVSKGSMWTVLGVNLLWAVLLLSTAWFFRASGARGLAVAYLIADTVRLLAGLFLLPRVYGARSPVAQ